MFFNEIVRLIESVAAMSGLSRWMKRSHQRLMIDGDKPVMSSQREWVRNTPCGIVDPLSLIFYGCDDMSGGWGVYGWDLFAKTSRQNFIPMNARVAAFLEENQEWLESVPRHIDCLLFPGTTVLDSHFVVNYVTCLVKRDGRWVMRGAFDGYRYAQASAVVAIHRG